MLAIPNLSATELINLCLELGLTGYDAFKEKKAKMLRFVMKSIMEFENTHDDGGAAKFVQIHNYLRANSTLDNGDKLNNLDDVKPPAASVPTPDFLSELAKLSKALAGSGDGNANQASSGMQTPLTGTQAGTKADIASLLLQTNPELLKLLQQQQQKEVVKPMVVKDLKFSGVIAGEGESISDKATRMSFSNLCYKIRNAQKQKYPEAAICNAILDAISPSNHLKTYFEMKSSLSINTMLSKLKSLYKEKDSTETLLEVSRAVQNTSESCLMYCSRLMCLRDKYILLKEEEGSVVIDKEDLAKTFMKSLFVGMRNANVRNELRENCKNLYKGNETDGDDDKLLSLVSEAMANELERSQRLLEGKKAEINVMQMNTANKENKYNNVGKDTAVKKEGKPNPLAQIEELKLEQQNQGHAIAALGTQLSEIASVLVSKSNVTSSAQPAAIQSQHIPNQQPLNQSHPSQFTPKNSAGSNSIPASQSPTPFQQCQQPNPLQNQPPQNQNMHANNQLPHQGYQQQSYQPQANQSQFPAQWPPMNPNAPPFSNQKYVPPHRRRGRCQPCTAANRWRCRHCFHCGADDHEISNCPTKN